jgi:NAD(P)-dependent dehydrogenase (short-subunit alcohol dehydrogenase family)
MQSLTAGYRALVIGASGTIGRAFHDALNADPLCHTVVELSRSTLAGFDFREPSSIEQAVAVLAPHGPFSVVIDASGVLSLDPSGPEKSLAAVRPAALNDLMQINAIGPLLLLRALTPHLARERCLYGKLSARVGSIADNRLGGWYGYRASKAALNMLLQTAAIELHRRLPNLVVAALQPGTVVSPLSHRFVSAATTTVSAAEAAAGLLKTLDQLPARSGAYFVDYRGESIPW